MSAPATDAALASEAARLREPTLSHRARASRALSSGSTFTILPLRHSPHNVNQGNMKNIIRYTVFAGFMSLVPALLAQTAPDSAGWHAHTVWGALFYTALFAMACVVLAILGYRIFDYFTPGDLSKEIFENKNVAAGLIGAALILGTCILVAAAMG